MTELFIENNRADLTEDLSALLTFALDDVQDFGARNTTFSKTIILPGTSRNNKLFGHIFDVRNANFPDNTQPNILYNFNAAKRAAALMFVDQIQTFKGYVRLLEIRIDRGFIEYEVAVFGELYGLVNAIGRSKLEDLDFSAYDCTWDITSIAPTAQTLATGAGVVFPLIDYGAGYGLNPDYPTAKHDWQFGTFRPALHVKEYIDKIFTAAGFTYDCSLFATDRFKRLVIPHNQKQLTKLSTTAFEADPENRSYSFGTPSTQKLKLTVTTAGDFTIDGANEVVTYNGATTVVNFDCAITGLITSITGTLFKTFTITLRKNGSSIASQTYNVSSTSMFYFSATLDANTISISSGDTFDIVCSTNATNVQFTIQGNILQIATPAPARVPLSYGDTIVINDTLPRNVLQKDFLTSIVKLFNLYVYDDPNKANHVKIAPYVDFYSTSLVDAVDWTGKVVRDKPMQIVPMAMLNSRFYDFKFKPDVDYYNDLYTKRYNETYGDRLYDSEFDFSDETNTVQLIFSPTVLVGYTGEDKVYSTILKLTNDTEEAIDSNIRILQTKSITGVTSWDIQNSDTVLGTYTEYVYAGHLDDPDAPSNDIHFGSPAEFFFTVAAGNISDNQFNLYWSSYMAEITDKDSKLLKCWLQLDVADIFNLDFSKLVWIDGALWRLNKIEDYNMTKPEIVKAEFLKVIEITY